MRPTRPVSGHSSLRDSASSFVQTAVPSEETDLREIDIRLLRLCMRVLTAGAMTVDSEAHKKPSSSWNAALDNGGEHGGDDHGGDHGGDDHGGDHAGGDDHGGDHV